MEVKKEYHRNGNICFRKEYENGQLHGIDSMYFEAYPGVVQWETPYVNGKRHGVEIEFNERGIAIYIGYYLYGSVVTKDEYCKHILIKQLSGI